MPGWGLPGHSAQTGLVLRGQSHRGALSASPWCVPGCLGEGRDGQSRRLLLVGFGRVSLGDLLLAQGPGEKVLVWSCLSPVQLRGRVGWGQAWACYTSMSLLPTLEEAEPPGLVAISCHAPQF